MARDKARRHAAKRLSSCAHNIAFGAADIGQDGLAQIHARQLSEHFFHGQDRHRQLNHISAAAGYCQIRLTAINHAQLYGQGTGCSIEIDADHFHAQPAFTQPLGKGAADEPQSDHYQSAHQGLGRLFRDDITHEQEPWSTLQASGCFQRAAPR